MKPLGQCSLYSFIDSAYLHGRDPADLARQLCDGGSDLIQLRAKDWDADRVREVAAEIMPILKAHDVGLVINDYLAVAQELSADFCHLGQEDFFDAGYSQVCELPSGRSPVRIGLSSHAAEQAQRAISAGADYVAIGPVFATGTKPTAQPVTLEYVRWAAANVRIPWFAIGGINLQTLDEVLAAGARRICVVSAILNSPSPADTCREFKRRLGTLS